jgi:hypothetical protein
MNLGDALLSLCRSAGPFILCLSLGGSLGGASNAAPPDSAFASRGATENVGSPRVLYTDILSGPNVGGEGNKGIYLSIFGKNFGAGGLGDRIKVYINNIEVDSYRYFGASRGRSDIQQISVQIGSIGNPAQGVPLPIKVVVAGVSSNQDHTFMVNPGRILFVDNVKGDDATAVPGSVSRPFRYVQRPDLKLGAWGAAQAGDFIVMRGTSTPWQDFGYEDYFLRARDKSGSPPMGISGTGPITLMGYPGEDVYINMPYSNRYNGAISAINGLTYPGMGQWMNVSNLRVEGGGNDGVINLEIRGHHWRVVNNELTASTARATAKAGGIVGNGRDAVFMGNYIHDVKGDGQHNHGIYIDGEGSYNIAFNRIEDITGGNGFQIYVNGSNGSEIADNVSLHHNWISDIGKHGINVSDNARAGLRIYNNVVSNTRLAGIRFNSSQLRDCKVYNNTIYGTNTAQNPAYGAVSNDDVLRDEAIDFRNNIVIPSNGTQYLAGTVGFGGGASRLTHNLWQGGAGPSFWLYLRRLAGRAVSATEIDSAPIEGSPGFKLPGKDFHLSAGSAAIDTADSRVAALVTNDYDALPRPLGKGFDVGAFEKLP